MEISIRGVVGVGNGDVLRIVVTCWNVQQKRNGRESKRQQTIASFNKRSSWNAQHQSSLSIQYNTIISNFSGIIKSDTMDAFHYSIYRRIFAIITFRQVIGEFISIGTMMLYLDIIMKLNFNYDEFQMTSLCVLWLPFRRAFPLCETCAEFLNFIINSHAMYDVSQYMGWNFLRAS